MITSINANDHLVVIHDGRQLVDTKGHFLYLLFFCRLNMGIWKLVVLIQLSMSCLIIIGNLMMLLLKVKVEFGSVDLKILPIIILKNSHLNLRPDFNLFHIVWFGSRTNQYEWIFDIFQLIKSSYMNLSCPYW